jgi:pimeloyl-ACP methyl ester carboxylesterase
MPAEPFTLATPAGRTLWGLVDLPAPAGPRPTVVVCHGFKGFMEWGFFPSLAELLAERGFTVVRFNFSGAGMRPGDELVTDPEAFRANTYAKEQEDLQAVMAALGEKIAAGRVDLDRLGLLGHSRGGAAALVAAASDPWRERVKALVTWAAIGRIDRVGREELALWRQSGEMPVVNTRTGQRLALGPEALAEVELPPSALDLPAAAGRRRAPWLIVHGSADESVPVEEGRSLERAAAEPRELLLVEGGSHTLGARHPFAGPTPHLTMAMNASQTWFLRYLG